MLRGLHHIRKGNCKLVALLGRNEIDCAGPTRSQFFGSCPEFAAKIVLTWRPRWVAGSTGSPRHNYAWYVWTDDLAANVATHGPRIFYAHKR
jgi:hypothetical protein